MAETIDFNEIGREFRNKGEILIPPRDGMFIIVRFIGQPKELYVHFDEETDIRTSISGYRVRFTTHKIEGKGTRRIVTFVIDREDDKIKAFACPISVLGQLETMNYDYEISCKGRMMQTRYTAKKLAQTDITEYQLKVLDATSKSYPLIDIFVNKIEWSLVSEVVEKEEFNLGENLDF